MPTDIQVDEETVRVLVELIELVEQGGVIENKPAVAAKFARARRLIRLPQAERLWSMVGQDSLPTGTRVRVAGRLGTITGHQVNYLVDIDDRWPEWMHPSHVTPVAPPETATSEEARDA